jgi:glycine oxidase
MKYDYIIVGCGLAGISFCEYLRKNNKSFIVFDDSSQQSSTVAGGLYNPVILKRFTKVWKSKLQIKLLKSFYRDLESLLNVPLDFENEVLRLFNNTEEQNMWFNAADHPELEDFISLTLKKSFTDAVKAPYDYGVVKQSGRVDTALLISSYKDYLSSISSFSSESFNPSLLTINSDSVTYNTFSSSNIVFCEGFGLKSNSFFNELPLVGTKGELIVINAPKLDTDHVIKSGVFLAPLSNHNYLVGATYEWTDKSNIPTEQGKLELIEKLDKFINCDYTIVKQLAGIRPTVKDRRPLVGTHKDHSCVHILNGLGTRGVMIGPYVAKQLYNQIENQTPIDSEIDINRFNY